jgi:hypothetical protein
VYPSGGANHNSQIRAICTPKMCILERRKTKQHLHDARFGLYERAVTFEGPQVYSESLPIRGCALSGQLQEVCDKVLKDISEFTSSKSQKHRHTTADMRMVLNLKVDSRDRIWVLYTSSICSISKNTNDLHTDISYFEESLPKSNTLLNLHDVISFSPLVKLTQYANHNPNAKVSNNKSIALCPSCGKMSVGENFYAIPYKTVISHYEKIMELSNSKNDCCSHPSPAIIKMAGGVGFGMMSTSENCNKNEDDVVIPPVIRFLHQRMNAEGYRRYRFDALFLHKTCDVCEDCFLAYAKLVSSSFQYSFPIQLENNCEEYTNYYSSSSLGIQKGSFQRKTGSCKGNMPMTNHRDSSLTKKNSGERERISSSLDCLFLNYPTLPQAIANPQDVELESDSERFMPLPYEEIESPHQPLMHLINMQTFIKKTNIVVTQPEDVNPYKIPLRLVDNCTKLNISNKKQHKKTNRKKSHHVNHN